MKKRLMIFGLSVVTILLAAVYSIAQDKETETESIGVYGTCTGESEKFCEFKCPICSMEYCPADGSTPKGEKGKLTRGDCVGCGYHFTK